jgi:hypothetical protein
VVSICNLGQLEKIQQDDKMIDVVVQILQKI